MQKLCPFWFQCSRSLSGGGSTDPYPVVPGKIPVVPPETSGNERFGTGLELFSPGCDPVLPVPGSTGKKPGSTAPVRVLGITVGF